MTATNPSLQEAVSFSAHQSIRSSKLRDLHLNRLAVVYVRQSSPQQVLENRESSARQYALVDRALALGWPPDRIVVIDEDQGQSGQTAEGRRGFQRLLLEVNLDHVGLILGLEMSRLARSSKDWHQLLEVCAIFRTLLADQDGLYEPNDPNDRLLLGLKGTLSEAETHTLRSRLLRGKLNKALRGELQFILPTGYVFSPSGKTTMDPDEQVQAVIRLVFEKFAEVGTIAGVVRYFAKNKIRLGFRERADLKDIQWRKACRQTVLGILHNPIYAGAYAYGRHRTDPRRQRPGRRGTGHYWAKCSDWHALLKDHHPAYISWKCYEDNQRQLAANRARRDALGAPRKGKALLGGLLFCGHCGLRMSMNYRGSNATYCCSRHVHDYTVPRCQTVAAKVLDDLVAAQVIAALKPAALELSLEAAGKIQLERDRLTQHWRQRLERAQYDTGRAKRQYDTVEPENRLVARELERQWERALLDERSVQDEYDRFLIDQPEQLTVCERNMITSLSADIPKLWSASHTTPADRKRIIRHLIERVTVTVQKPSEVVDVTVHWVGGFVSQHQVYRPVKTYERLHHFDQLLAHIIDLRDRGHTSAQIAEQLNKEGCHSPRAGRYTNYMVRQVISRHTISTHPRPRYSQGYQFEKNEWLSDELARQLNMPASTIRHWRIRGWVFARQLPGRRTAWIYWADDNELQRLQALRMFKPTWPDYSTPEALTTPRRPSET